MTSSKLSSIKVWIFSAALTAGLLSLTSCQINRKPSIIIVAIDRLAFNTFSCGDDKQNLASGLNILCKEGIRFTHAYTTSTQPAAALGSLLTGLYPTQHKLHRSFDRLGANVKTVQEHANNLGYRTYFFGGSPSVLRKTRLHSGFDIFDDASFIEKKTYFVDFKFQTEKLLNVLNEDKTQFFSLIHNSELESLNEGETEISSFEKLDDKILKFFTQLKSKNLWDQNYIVVVGLQGESDYSRPAETPFSNLNSENTMVTLLIKPPRNKGDEGVSWKVDSPVSLADIGHSLWKTLADTSPPNQNMFQDSFPIFDVSDTWLKQNKSLVLPPRRLLIESTDTWNRKLYVRFAVLFKNLVFIEGQKNQVFNTLTDGLESIDISKRQKQFVDENSMLLSKLRTENELGIWFDHQSEWNSWVLTNREYWSKPNSRASIFKIELSRLNQKSIAQPLSALLLKHLGTNKKAAEIKNINVGPLPIKPGIPYDLQKESFYEGAKLHSLNLALENIWGIWKPNQSWLYSDLILENQ